MNRRTIGLLAAVLAIALSLWLDPWVWRHVENAAVYERDWGRLLRVMGSLVFWLPLAAAVWLGLRARPAASAARAGWLVLLGPALAGGGAELLKMVLRRERPGLHDGVYFFRSFSDQPFNTKDLGLPSSHAMVAFGGAAVIARVFPGVGPVAYALAAGCAVTRVLARAHFASDVVVGAIAGWAVGALLWARFRPGRPAQPVEG